VTISAKSVTARKYSIRWTSISLGSKTRARAALCELLGLRTHPTHPEGIAGIHLARQRGRAAVVRGDGRGARDLCRAGNRVRSAERVRVRNRPLLEGVGLSPDDFIHGREDLDSSNFPSTKKLKNASTYWGGMVRLISALASASESPSNLSSLPSTLASTRTRSAGTVFVTAQQEHSAHAGQSGREGLRSVEITDDALCAGRCSPARAAKEPAHLLAALDQCADQLCSHVKVQTWATASCAARVLDLRSRVSGVQVPPGAPVSA